MSGHHFIYAFTLNILSVWSICLLFIFHSHIKYLCILYAYLKNILLLYYSANPIFLQIYTCYHIIKVLYQYHPSFFIHIHYLYNPNKNFQLIKMKLQIHPVCQPGAYKIHWTGIPLLKNRQTAFSNTLITCCLVKCFTHSPPGAQLLQIPLSLGKKSEVELVKTREDPPSEEGTP